MTTSEPCAVCTKKVVARDGMTRDIDGNTVNLPDSRRRGTKIYCYDHVPRRK